MANQGIQQTANSRALCHEEMPDAGKEDKKHEASEATRRIASDLIASCYRIPLYPIFSRTAVFPRVDAVNDVRKQRIGLSNSTHDGDPLANGRRVDRINKLLKIPNDY